MGKTRLVTELARRMSERGIAVLGGRCQEGGSDPYQPFAEAFDRALVSSPGWMAQVPADALASELAALTPAFEAGPLPLGPLRPLDSHTGQARIHHAAIRLLDALAQIEPLVLIIDDAEWATPTTCQLLGALVDALPLRNESVDRTSGRNWSNGITVIVTCRSGPRETGATPELPAGLRPHLESAPALELSALDEARVGELVALFDGVGEDPKGNGWSAQRLVELTGGNPLFITELLKSSHGPGQVAPHSLSRFITAELARLGVDLVRAAECICVDRGGVEPFVVQAVTQVEAEALERACAAAIAAGIVRESHESRHVRLVICHDVTREAIESSLTANRLAELRRP